MAQLGHSDGQKASLWIDPKSHYPEWPTCAHFDSFTKSPVTALLSQTWLPLTREETIWSIYRDWILQGTVDTNAGEYRVWKAEDEFDPLEKTDIIYQLVDFGEDDGLDGKMIHRTKL